MRFWQMPFRSGAAYVIAITIVLGTTINSRADIEPKRIMMLHSFGLRFKPWTDYAETIRSDLSRKSKWPLDFHDHSLLNARLRDDQSDGPFVDYLHAVYRETPPDLIIAFGAPAASFIQRYRARLFPQTPMVFAIEARRVQYDKLTENDTIVATHNDFAAAFESFLHVLPNTKMIAIVNGVSPNEKFWLGGEILSAHIASLTPRERQVFELIVRGKINKQIAHHLGTAERTIKARRQRVMEKMRVQSVAELVSAAVRLGMLSE